MRRNHAADRRWRIARAVVSGIASVSRLAGAVLAAVSFVVVLRGGASVPALAAEEEGRATVAGGFAVRGVDVLDGTGADLQRDRAVVVRDGRIEAILKSAELEESSVGRVIDGRGKVMIPGMWDMHVHVQEIGEAQMAVFLAHGVTGVRDMGGAPGLTLQRRDAIEAGELVGPRIKAAAYMITTPRIYAALQSLCSPAQWKEEEKRRLVVATAAEARAAVQKIHASGADFIKLHWNENLATYVALAEEARKVGLRFAGHDPLGVVTIEQWLEHGQHSIEHIDGTYAMQLGQRPAAGQEEWMSRAAAAGLHFVPTLLLARELSSLNSATTPPAKLARALEHPQAAYVPQRLRDFWNMFFQMIPPAVPGLAAYEMQTKLLARFHDVGIRLMPGTDLGVPLVFPGWSLIEELELFVDVVGMTPNEAIQSATRIPAEFFGMGDDLGTIEAGKLADLVLLDADPLDSIGALRDVSAVVRAGRFLDREALDGLLDKARVAER